MAATRSALAALSVRYPSDHIAGVAGNVSEYNAVQNLWDEGVSVFGNVDIWTNNAGISHEQAPPWLIPAQELQAVVQTNILGELFGTQVAIQGFLQQGFGALYNMEGMGADGKTRGVKGLSVYGMTKAYLHFFNRSLADEITHPQIVPGSLQPGMVLTDLIMDRYRDCPQDWDADRKILSMIASPIEDVAEWMAEKIITNKKNGEHFKYSSTWRILKRMMTTFLQRTTHRG